MKFRGTAFDQGFKLAELSDGLSKVPLVAETRERRFASWYDGTMNWVVAARHSNPAAGTIAIIPRPIIRPPFLPGMADSRWTVGTDGTIGNRRIGIELRPHVRKSHRGLSAHRCTGRSRYIQHYLRAAFGDPVVFIVAESLIMYLAMHMWNRSVTRSTPMFTFGSSPATAARRFRIRELYFSIVRAAAPLMIEPPVGRRRN